MFPASSNTHFNWKNTFNLIPVCKGNTLLWWDGIALEKKNQTKKKNLLIKHSQRVRITLITFMFLQNMTRSISIYRPKLAIYMTVHIETTLSFTMKIKSRKWQISLHLLTDLTYRISI